ncbi:MAG: glycosyltransferase [Bacteroidota bacterium]|nr:glycosyltransferase [Bacteroidota bacterium]
MKLSIVIVNYNVRSFLEQCLFSVQKAMNQIAAEIFVVDNNSVDGSCAMVDRKFPSVHLIRNKSNKGFAYANNQAIRQASGDYILLLNPDTVVQEDCFQKCIAFMDSHPEAGALGVKMINGRGEFLPESKRSLPKPSVAFYKIFGLSKLFPNSKIFGRYHLGYLDKNHVQEVEILPGAFMFLRKQALEKVGLLDEDFFMYGEDIDLSYRILKGGYKNYYFPETAIIHYKGESTRKGSLNYVLVFYKAMLIFTQKHFSRKNRQFLSLLINIAVFFRAALAILSRIMIKIGIPLLDAFIIFIGMFGIKIFWENYEFGAPYYSNSYLFYVIPSYCIVWVTSVFFAGGYDPHGSLKEVVKGLLSGTIIILVIYALLPLSLRFSRMMILFGTCWALISLPLTHLLLAILHVNNHENGLNRKKKLVIVGSISEGERVEAILNQSNVQHELCGFVSPAEPAFNYLGSLEQLKDIVIVHKVSEIIFCAKDVKTQDIVRIMLRLSDLNPAYKIAAPESYAIIGSNSSDLSGEIYDVNFNSIGTQQNRRKKRLFDLVLSLLLIFVSPLMIVFIKHPFKFCHDLFSVIWGLFSWVGYSEGEDISDLPVIRKGIFSPSVFNPPMSDLLYAKNYLVANDLKICILSILQSGRKFFLRRN